MSAALAYRADGSEAALVFQMHAGSYNTESLIEFLEEFHTHVVEQLPGYSPDLNPVELVWGNVKGRELANLCPDTMDEAEAAADAALLRVGNNTQLCFNFLAHTGLSL
jgi:transposase